MSRKRLLVCILAALICVVTLILIDNHKALASGDTGVFFLADFTINPENPFTSPSGSAWRGYAFQVNEEITVTHLIGGGTSAGQFMGAVLTANTDHVGNPTTPGHVLAQALFPGDEPGQEERVAPFKLTPGVWYFIVQGRAGTTGTHYLLNPLNMQSVRDNSPVSKMHPDSGFHALSFAGVTEPNALSGKASNSTSDKPAVGFIYEREQHISFMGGDWQARTYGDADFMLIANASSGLDVTFTSSNEEVALVLGNVVQIRGIGNTEIAARQNGAGSYASATSISHTLSVLPRPMSLLVHSASKIYGEPDPLFSYDILGLLEQDSLTGAPEREAGENVGSYYIGVGSLEVPVLYDAHFARGVLTIEPRSLTITALPVSKFAGDNDPSLMWQLVQGELIEGDMLAGELVRALGESPGTYQISIGSLFAGPNYTIDFTPVDFTIRSRPVYVPPFIYHPEPPVVVLPPVVKAPDPETQPQEENEPESPLPVYELRPLDAISVKLPVGLTSASNWLLLESDERDTPVLLLPTSIRVDRAESDELLMAKHPFVLYMDPGGIMHYIYDCAVTVPDKDSRGASLEGTTYLQVEFKPQGSGAYMVAIFTDTDVDIYLTDGRIVGANGDVMKTPCYYRGNDVMMPTVMLTELGIKYEKDNASGEIIITSPGRKLRLNMNSAVALVNDELTMVLGASGSLITPEMAGDETMIPLRFTLERLGWLVEWQPTGRVVIRRP